MAPERKDLGELVRKQMGQPYKLSLDLTQQLADMEFPLAGRVLAIWSAPSSVEYIDVKFNRQDAHPIRFTRGKVLAVPFTKLFITAPAGQTGIMDILYGPDAFEILRIYPTVPEYDTTLDDILARLTNIYNELHGPMIDIVYHQRAVGLVQSIVLNSNVTRIGGIIQACSTNTGIVYLGFDNTVAANNAFVELAPSSSWSFDDYCGDIFGVASLAAQNIYAGHY